MAELALFGGRPVWDGGWPVWPVVTPRTGECLKDVLESGRWAISGQWTGSESWDQRFNVRFADYVGVRFCFTIDHGSSGILAALLALDIGPGDEVILPGLTWVACASAVMRVGAVPVPVDIDVGSLCIDPGAVEAAVTERTRCILVVHLYSCMADVDAIRRIAMGHGVKIVEDCAQAHGAEWNGRRAGSFGDIAVFSMQQGKTLTSGEGGAVLTDDPILADRLERLRCDGRRYGSEPRRPGHQDLEEVRGLQGVNLCLSEFQAALLCDGLERLEEQITLRVARAAYLDRSLGCDARLEPVTPYPNNTRRAYYHYGVRLSQETIERVPVARICQALVAELGAEVGDRVREPYPPLCRHTLFAPNTLRALPRVATPVETVLPVVDDQARRTVLFHHSLLLADEEAMDAVALAFEKVLGGLDWIAAVQ